MKILEKHIAQTCSQFLELDGWRSFKMEPISRREWGKGTGEIGQADYLYLRYGKGATCEHMHIEWKKRGGKAAQHQQAWHAKERARGALTLIAGENFPASIEGFTNWYRDSGLQRKKIGMPR